MRNTASFDLAGARLYTPSAVIEKGVLEVREGRIHSVRTQEEWERSRDSGTAVRDAGGARVVPGFVDVHVHGGGGYDFMTGHDGSLEEIRLYHAAHGTTSLLATTVTAGREPIAEAIRMIVREMKRGGPGAEVAGIHLEGPYLNPVRCGAQNPENIRAADLDEIRAFWDLSEGTVRLVTLAPELEGGLEATRFFRARGVTVSIGHSDASLAETREAVREGASHITHLFNGMRPFHHREPGLTGGALLLGELTVEMICDGIHIHPEAVRYVWETKPRDRIVFITDSMGPAGLPDGTFRFEGMTAAMRDGILRLVQADGTEGSLAGSTLTMDKAMRNVMQWTGASLEDVLPALTLHPARQAGLAGRKGSLEAGKDADFVWLNDDDTVAQTWVGGVRA
ncbi:N-acetylglucosamine-6-phosphate deacetylase [Cohnella nanjingensis]|uniref:N-acetylglucosamine-6-phosphate deacetylase n=1 Tax=Cohnella nanjingensis TaxID=1387779 RepID=A0A7X0RQ72_9BACL|nr:N-acetylglucosamine-6-phosphate deacetylase [Cohnella nanjingensis]MBB6671627.1 N-acetylglucosamine-6-phosphate deacetylase [Cohnella nanjingensis]